MVTPELATQWLEKNTDNRPMRQSHVELLAREMREGKWQLMPDGIAFDTNGVLMNGQHRLWAVVESGMTVPMRVTFDALPGNRLVLDRQAVRNLGDNTKISQKWVNVYSSMIQMSKGRSYKPSPSDIVAMHAYFGRVCSELHEYCGSPRKFYSCAAVRAAVITAVHTGTKQEYVFKCYRDLVTYHLTELPPALGHLIRYFDRYINNRPSVLASTGSPANQIEIFAHALCTFRHTPGDTAQFQVHKDDMIRVLKELRVLVTKALENEKPLDPKDKQIETLTQKVLQKEKVIQAHLSQKVQSEIIKGQAETSLCR